MKNNSKVQIFNNHNSRYTIYVSKTKKAYDIGEKEYNIIKDLENKVPSKTIQECYNFSEKEFEILITYLENIGILSSRKIKRKYSLKNILKIKFGIISPNKFLENHRKSVSCIGFIISKLSIPIFILSLVFVGKDLSIGFNIKNIATRILSINNIILFEFVAFISLSIHELSHGIVAKIHGANIPEIGIMIYYFAPCAYCSICGVNYIEDKYKRISIFLAGIKSNLLIIAICLFVSKFTTKGLKNEILLYFIFTNLTCTIVNLFIYLKYDAYYIICELLNDNKLRENSFKILNRSYRNELNIDLKFIYSTYFIMSTLTILLIPISIICSIIFTYGGGL